jgi:hypothetical protein
MKTKKIPDLPEYCSPKVKELFRLAVLASEILIKRYKPCKGEAPHVIYIEAQTYLDDLKKYATAYDKPIVQGTMTRDQRDQEAGTFFDEALWVSAVEMNIRFEIGSAWENVDFIRDSLEIEEKVE